MTDPLLLLVLGISMILFSLLTEEVLEATVPEDDFLAPPLLSFLLALILGFLFSIELGAFLLFLRAAFLVYA